MNTDSDPLKVLVDYTRGLLDRLDEFFVRATGCRAVDFSSVSQFGETVRSKAKQIAPRGEDAFIWLDTEVRKFQARGGIAAFKAAKSLGGARLVLGGSSRFGETHLNSVRNSLLYGDTVLIPDPVLPWLERERKEERFQHVLVLQTVHCLLHLKPLVDADLPYPALVIFPSWEKSLEENDEVTIGGIRQLVTDVIASSVEADVSSLEEAVELSDRFPDEFFRAAEKRVLVVGPGGPVGEPLTEALRRYEEDLKTWRSPEWLHDYDQLPPQRKVLNILFERITPIYHLIENAQELRGHPLMCIEQQAHYFKLVSELSGTRLEGLDVIKPETLALVNSLGSRRLEWLGNVSMDALIELRINNENEEFRGVLSGVMGRLQASDLDDVDLVAAEVCRELDGAIATHHREMRSIQKKYNRAHGQSLILGTGALGAMLIPALMPLLGSVAPLALAGKYGHDKVAELQEKRELTHSLIGVLASAKANG
ncbi:MAG: hypothetical protein PVH77_12005 [Phycisphaerales bacterium]|jgi:hypothetical protein